MSPENKGLNIIYEPVVKKVELDKETREKISGKLEGFFEEENLWGKITPDMTYLMATYPNGDFTGGPRFMIKPDENPAEKGWWLRISFGQTNYMEFTLNKEDKALEITELTFAERGYSSLLIEGWIDNVLNGIRTAQKRDSFEWDIK